LDGFDHFVKENLHIKKYLPYVDDFALFSNNAQLLTDARMAIEVYLAGLRLRIHPIKSQLFETEQWANFVGFRIGINQIRVRMDNLRRARKRMRHLQLLYKMGMLTREKLR
jgi:retron-type reverse transcriptase